MATPDYPHAVSATLWEYIEPMDRGERYEDPLMEALEARNLGTVDGGGTQLSDQCGIEFVDIEMSLANLDESLQLAREILEKQGASKGSVFRFERDGEVVAIPFGVNELVGIYLDGVSLPDEVYAEADLDVLAEQITAALGETGTIRGFWTGETETAVFLSGPNADAMVDALQPVFASYPLCQNARVVVRHGEKGENPREFRVPMRA